MKSGEETLDETSGGKVGEGRTWLQSEDGRGRKGAEGDSSHLCRKLLFLSEGDRIASGCGHGSY